MDLLKNEVYLDNLFFWKLGLGLIAIFVLFVKAKVLFNGAILLWVSLINAFNKNLFTAVVS